MKKVFFGQSTDSSSDKSHNVYSRKPYVGVKIVQQVVQRVFCINLNTRLHTHLQYTSIQSYPVCYWYIWSWRQQRLIKKLRALKAGFDPDPSTVQTSLTSTLHWMTAKTQQILKKKNHMFCHSLHRVAAQPQAGAETTQHNKSFINIKTLWDPKVWKFS